MWLVVRLKTTLTNRAATHDDITYSVACQLRASMIPDHVSMSRTTLQRTYEIACFR